MDQQLVLTLAVAFLVTAVLYSSVGHAGASGYLAAMAFLSVPPSIMKPTALTLNLLVGTIALVRFSRAGFFSWRLLWPFALGSVPLAYMGGAITLPGQSYKTLVGLVLLVAAARLVWDRNAVAHTRPHAAPTALAILCGAAIGLLSGLTGTGGGIFLSPLLLFTGWAQTRETGGVSAAFILVNSAAGLLGNLASVQHLPSAIPIWATAAVIGGLVGSELGARRIGTPIFRTLLALVLVVAGGKLILT